MTCPCLRGMAPAYKVYEAARCRTGLEHLKACESLHPAALGPARFVGKSGDMDTPVVLITGALTGSGVRGAAFARDGNRIVVARFATRPRQELRAELRGARTDVDSCARMCATRTRCGA